MTKLSREKYFRSMYDWHDFYSPRSLVLLSSTVASVASLLTVFFTSRRSRRDARIQFEQSVQQTKLNSYIGYLSSHPITDPFYITQLRALSEDFFADNETRLAPLFHSLFWQTYRSWCLSESPVTGALTSAQARLVSQMLRLSQDNKGFIASDEKVGRPYEALSAFLDFGRRDDPDPGALARWSERETFFEGLDSVELLTSEEHHSAALFLPYIRLGAISAEATCVRGTNLLAFYVQLCLLEKLRAELAEPLSRTFDFKEKQELRATTGFQKAQRALITKALAPKATVTKIRFLLSGYEEALIFELPDHFEIGLAHLCREGAEMKSTVLVRYIDEDEKAIYRAIQTPKIGIVSSPGFSLSDIVSDPLPDPEGYAEKITKSFRSPREK